MNIFNRVAAQCSYQDPRMIEGFYNGLKRVIMQELVSEGKVILPDIGSFRIVRHKARRTKLLHQMGTTILPAKITIKFLVNRNLKDYVRGRLNID